MIVELEQSKWSFISEAFDLNQLEAVYDKGGFLYETILK